METRQDLDPGTRRRFQTGRMCLDFSHTGGEGDFARWEILHDTDDATRFLSLIIGLDRIADAIPDDLNNVRSLRSAITAVARTLAIGAAVPAAMLEVINRFASKPTLVPQVDDQLNSTLQSGSVEAALATLARDAIDLFSSPLATRIRTCEADDCALLFVDASRPGKRRWCSMEWCGDRAKKHAAGRSVPDIAGN